MSACSLRSTQITVLCTVGEHSQLVAHVLELHALFIHMDFLKAFLHLKMALGSFSSLLSNIVQCSLKLLPLFCLECLVKSAIIIVPHFVEFTLL